MLPAVNVDLDRFVRILIAPGAHPGDRSLAIQALDELADTGHYRDFEGNWRGPVPDPVILSLFAMAYRNVAMPVIEAAKGTSCEFDSDDEVLHLTMLRAVAKIRAQYQREGVAPRVHSPGLIASAARYAYLDCARRAYRKTRLDDIEEPPSGHDGDAPIDTQMRHRWIRRHLTDAEYADFCRLAGKENLSDRERQRKSRLKSKLQKLAATVSPQRQLSVSRY